MENNIESCNVSEGVTSFINLADFAITTNVLGPGRRAIIWVQGCPRRCHNCITPHMQRFDIIKERITPTELADRVIRNLPLEGITFVGGEPFSHAHQLSELVKILRCTIDLSVLTYSGHRLTQILAARRADWEELLAVTDILIDGEYVESLACDLIWRGSSNQQMHFLNKRYQQIEQMLIGARGRLIEISVSSCGELRVIGIPEPGFFDRFSLDLGKRGIEFVTN